MQVVVLWGVQVVSILLEIVEWEVNDQTVCKIVSCNVTVFIWLELIEFVMPQLLLD